MLQRFYLYVNVPIVVNLLEDRVSISGDVAAVVMSRMNGLQPFESTTEQTTGTMPPNPKTITAAAMTTNRITSLRELVH